MKLDITFEAMTLHDYFEKFRGTGVRAMSWRDYWLLKWADVIDLYLNMGFFLIPLPKHSKVPFGKFNWTTGNYGRDALLTHVKEGGNLAVVAGLCSPKLVLVDCDSPLVLDDYPATMTMRSARGVQFFTKEPFDEVLGERLKKKFPDIDSFRTQIMYSLVPLSVTCFGDSGNGCSEKGHAHDWRVRDWLYRGKLMSFRAFAKAMLAHG